MKIYPEIYKNSDNRITIKWENDFEEKTLIRILQPQYSCHNNDWRPVIGFMYANVLHILPMNDKQFKAIKKTFDKEE